MPPLLRNKSREITSRLVYTLHKKFTIQSQNYKERLGKETKHVVYILRTLCSKRRVQGSNLFVCLFIYLLTQAGFSGSYAADVGLRPTASFPRV